MTATELRRNLYKILDRVLETGMAVEIERKGRTLRIVPQQEGKKLDRLEKHTIVTGDPEELVHIDWSEMWTEGEKV